MNMYHWGVRVGAVGWGTALQVGRSRVRIPMVSVEIFIDIILPAALLVQGSTQPLTEMSIRNISWGGTGGRCVGMTTLQPSCADYPEIWEPQLPGTLWACPGLYENSLLKWFMNQNEYVPLRGTSWCSWLRHCATKSEGRGFDYRWCQWNFSLT